MWEERSYDAEMVMSNSGELIAEVESTTVARREVRIEKQAREGSSCVHRPESHVPEATKLVSNVEKVR